MLGKHVRIRIFDGLVGVVGVRHDVLFGDSDSLSIGVIVGFSHSDNTGDLWLVTVVERAILARIFTNDDVQHDGFIDYHCDTALVFDLLAEDSAKRDLMQQHLVSIIFGVIIVFRFFDCFIDELGVCF